MSLSRILPVLAFFVLILPAQGALAQQGSIPPARGVVQENTDFFGSDLRMLRDTTLEICANACANDSACRALTYNTTASACFLKTEISQRMSFGGAVSIEFFRADEATLARAVTRAAEIAFVPSDWLRRARVQADTIGLEMPLNGRDPVELARLGRRAGDEGDLLGAIDLLSASVSATDDPGTWAQLAAIGARVETGNWSRDNELRSMAQAAAVNAYLRSESDQQRVAALEVMANLLERSGYGDVSVKALRLAAQLDSSPRIADSLDRAIGLFGFRITGHRVENNAEQPRICVSFSEDLRQLGQDYSPFVRLSDAGLAVSVQDYDLCIDGVRHGARYDLTLRQGLPAASGETLHRSSDLTVYVRDRDPSVRFAGRAYVLPRAAGAGIPIVTVNTERVLLDIHWIGERNVLPAMDNYLIGEMLSNYGQQRLDETWGAPIWSGETSVQPELNRDVTVSLPVDEAIGAMRPGVYAMVARVPTGDDRPWESAATQWFIVTDIGVEALSGNDGLNVFVRGLSDTQPSGDAEVRVLARNNTVLATARTGADGHVRIEQGYLAGRGGQSPALLTVSGPDGDFAWLDLTQAGLDLSDRGVDGRPVPPPVDVFVTTERGAYRPGETVFATILARDSLVIALESLPLTAIVIRPDGVEHRRDILADQGGGGRFHAFDLPPAAMRGTWQIHLHADPAAPALTTARLLVEDFVPERIDFDLDLAEGLLLPLDEANVSLEARYLFGAPGAGLRIEGEGWLTAGRRYAGHENWLVGQEDEDVSARYLDMSAPEFAGPDGRGHALVGVPSLDGRTRPANLTVTVRLSDGSGRPVERSITRQIAPEHPVIGLRPLFDGAVGEGENARFEVIALASDGAGGLIRADLPAVDWVLERVQTRYQWYQSDGYWRWEPITTRIRVASGALDLTAAAVQVIDAPVDWGRYELRLTGAQGPRTITSHVFYAGWFGAGASIDSPDLLEVALDREAYAAGDTAQLRVVARDAGWLEVRVLSDRLITRQTREIVAGEVLVDLSVTEDWGTGAYVSATLIQPMDARAGRNPTRAIGLAHAAVDPTDRVLAVRFDMPNEAAPRQPLEVVMALDDHQPGDMVWASIAAVDLGILNLTGFASPDPASHYHARRALGVEIRDYYGRLIEGHLGVPGQLRSGGDAGGLRDGAPPPREQLLAFAIGPVRVADDGTARVSFDLPQFNGTVRLMAVVWSSRAVGSASHDLLVRDPVVMATALPRYLAPGDTSRLLVELTHATGPAGEVQVTVSATGAVKLLDSSYSARLNLPVQGRGSVEVPIIAGPAGTGALEITLTTPDGRILTRQEPIEVRVNDPEVVRQHRVSMAAGGGELQLDRTIFDAMMPGTARATLATGPLADFDVPGLLAALDRYPYGCSEQVVSAALPLLYLQDVAIAAGLGEAERHNDRIARAIDAVLSNQSAAGSFGLWRPESGDLWLDAYVTDFLLRAREQGHSVPAMALTLALDNLANQIAYAGDFENAGQDLAYALMILARERRASIGDLRYYADEKAGDFATPLALAQLGTALALYGDPVRANALFTRATEAMARTEDARNAWRPDYGSLARDRAAVLTLAVENGIASIDRAGLQTQVAASSGRAMSTQEQLWTLLAAHALALRSGDTEGLTVNGRPMGIVPVMGLDAAMLDTAPLLLRNKAAVPVQVVLTTSGVPLDPEPASAEGYLIERWVYELDGTPADLGAIAQNDRLLVILRVTPEMDRRGRLMLNSPLPAGLEIENPAILRTGTLAGVDWLALDDVAEHAEFREDRFLAAVDWGSTGSFQMAFVVRAISPGTYHFPAASVEDMYRPALRGRTDASSVTVLPAR